jgi:hypothetical protein
MIKTFLVLLFLTGFSSGIYSNESSSNINSSHQSKKKRELTVYPALPDNQYRSDLYEVTILQGRKSSPSYVYKNTKYLDDPDGKFKSLSTDANHWTSFSFNGTVTVQIKFRDGLDIKSASVRPLSRQIRANISNNTISFKLTKSTNVFVEVAGKSRDPLFIFANPPEIDVPSANTPNVIYFGPGVTDLGKTPLNLTDGQTVYLAGGAYVKGRIFINGGAYKKNRSSVVENNVVENRKLQPPTIRGRGILSGIGILENRNVFSNFMISGDNLNIEGIVISDAPGANCVCEKKLIAENVKLLSWAMCSDGLHGSDGTIIKNCFLKVNDDNIHFHSTGMKAIDNVVWIQQFGSALLLGWNVSKTVDGELVDGLDIIGHDIGKTQTDKTFMNANVVSLRDVRNKAMYKNVVIQNVRHEGKPYQIFGIRTKLAAEDTNHANFRVGKGGIDGMIFRNFSIAQNPLHLSVFDGAGTDPGSIENITFENLQIAGILVTESNASSYIVQRGKTSGFHFTPLFSKKGNNKN